jgi:hypothetical protein
VPTFFFDIHFLSYIYLGYFVCLCVTIAERSAILLPRRRDGGFGDGGIREGEIGKRQIEAKLEKHLGTVPPAIALLN